MKEILGVVMWMFASVGAAEDGGESNGEDGRGCGWQDVINGDGGRGRVTQGGAVDCDGG